MMPIDFKKTQPNDRRPAFLRRLPRLHVMAAVSLAGVLGLSIILPSERASASRQSIAIDIPMGDDEALADAPEPEPPVESVWDIEESGAQIEQTVRSGDSLSAIFQRAGLSDRDMLELVNSGPEAKKLARLYPGHEFIFQLGEDNRLNSLVHVIDRLNRHVYTREEGGFSFAENQRTPDSVAALRSNTITSSLYRAGLDAQLDDRLIMGLASIFGWDIDFALDLRAGDSFKILFEETFLEGERIGTGNILAAEFVNRGATFRAVRYVDAEGRAQYYTPNGEAMRKAFLRAPLDFRRISSNFNPRRLHPITNTVRPHRGTDYAANRGTPVWASGDGRVTASGYTRANGNYIVIQHGSDIETKYLHLDKRHVKRGDRVRQKQVIGTVGSTGYSTAPHLHYEFLVNGTHRNPRTIIQKLPKAESIAKSELPRFFAQTQSILAKLDQSIHLAAGDTDSNAL